MDTTTHEHPHDRECYEAFAHAMGWAVEWWDLGTERDIPGPGKLPFVLAFRRVRELLAEGGTRVPGSTVDHWGEYLRQRETRQTATPPRPPRRRRTPPPRQ